jgi:hypothetical protein
MESTLSTLILVLIAVLVQVLALLVLLTLSNLRIMKAAFGQPFFFLKAVSY